MAKRYQKGIAVKTVLTTLQAQFGYPRLKVDEPLAKYSTLRIGGPADIFLAAQTKNDIIKAVQIAQNHDLQVTILGGATNLVIADSGVRGLVIKNECQDIRMISISGAVRGQETAIGTVVVEASAGVLVNQLVRYTVDEGIAGLELFLGQPGTVGGAMYINAHNMRKGLFFGDHVLEATILTLSGDIQTVPVSYFRFGYDKSRIQKTKDIVLAVKFRLTRGDKTKLWQQATEAMNYRRTTQPLGLPSSGCTFRNIAKSEALRLNTPNHTTSAGYLLDLLGFKGKQIGQAKFSEKHANFIVNLGGAQASDVMTLIMEAKEKVKEKFGVNLVEEVVLLGEF